MRWLAIVLAAGCAAHRPPLAIPTPESGRITVIARAAPRLGGVQPVEVALTNGGPEPLRVDPRQVYALDGDGARFAPLPPADAARAAGGKRLPGAVRRGAIGAATGGAIGAVGGVIAGAIQGGMGAAVAVGSAVGALFGAVGGVLSGGSPPDVEGFTSRALPETTLASGLSAEGWVYYPPGRYGTLEVLFPPDGDGATRREHVTIAETP